VLKDIAASTIPSKKRAAPENGGKKSSAKKSKIGEKS
jgi:hypothetical protein